MTSRLGAASARSSSSAASDETRMPTIAPPSNAISMRTRSSRSLATRDDLREHAVHRVGVDERDLQPEQTLVRLLVDQLRTLAREPGQRLREIADLVGDVVHPGPPLGEEASDVRVLAQGRD